MDTRIQKAVEDLEKLYTIGCFPRLTPSQFFTTTRIGIAIWERDKSQRIIDTKAITDWLILYRPNYLEK